MSKLPSIKSLEKKVYCENEYFALAKIYNFLRKFGKETVQTQKCPQIMRSLLLLILDYLG